jgi:hypothetical protein
VITPESKRLRLKTTAPIVTTTPTLSQLRKLFSDGELKHADLANFLAAAKVFQEQFGHVPPEYQSAVNALIPIEVLAMAGEVLVGRSEWSKAENEAKAQTARVRKTRIQREAEKHWQQDWNLRPLAVAGKIVADPAMRTVITIHYKSGRSRVIKAGTIRKMIKQPKK